MKVNKYIAIALLGLLSLSSCKSLLEKEPYGQLTEDLIDESAMSGLLAASYAGLNPHFFDDNNNAFAGPSTNWIFDVRSDDALKGGGATSMEGNIHNLETSNIFSDDYSVLFKWKNNYFVLARVNKALIALDAAKDLPNKAHMRGELLILRAYYYFDLVRIFKDGCLVLYTEKDDANTIPNNATHEQVFNRIIEDLTDAYNTMEPKRLGAGRFEKYTAAALLAKVYAQMANEPWAPADCWNQVIKYAEDVIGCGNYSLYNRFQDMSVIDMNNTHESIIAMQTSVADDYATYNRSNLLNKTYSDKNIYGTADDFFYGSQNLADAFRVNDDGLPYFDQAPEGHVGIQALNDTMKAAGIEEKELIKADNYTGKVDPRLDFTVGRLGYPFRGYTYNSAWCRVINLYGQFSNKKDCPDPQDSRVSKSFPWGASPLNFCFLRYADILLLAAEGYVESNDQQNLGRACDLVNEIRQKALRSIDPTYVPVDLNLDNMTEYAVGLYTDFPSKEYARQAVRTERRLELALEGHRWFDLLRWGKNEAVETMNEYFSYEQLFHTYYKGQQVSLDELYFPTPYEEITNSNGLYK